MADTELEALAHEAGLQPVGARPRLGAYIKELWLRRAFAMSLAQYRIRATMGQNRLGLGWIVLRPILNAALFGTVFGIIMSSESRPQPFVPYLVVGIFIFEFFSKSFGGGAKSITSNASLVRSLNFPRMLLPIAHIIQQVFELIPMMIVLGLILIVLGVPISWTWLLAIPILALMTLFNLGIALIAARMTVHIRDVTQVIPLLTRLLFYSSGIFYSLEMVLEDRPQLLVIAQLNPVHDYIALVRMVMIDQPATVAPVVWTVAVVAAVAFFVIGFVFFWRAEERYGRD